MAEIGIGGIVKPYQKPHPPIFGTSSDPNSKGLVALGRRGWWPISSHFLHSNHLPSQWSNYARGCAEGGRKADRANWRVARSIFVADDDNTARAYGGDVPKSPYRFYMNQLTAKLRRGKKLDCFKMRPEMTDDDVTLDYIFDNLVLRAASIASSTAFLSCASRPATSARCFIAAWTGPIRRWRGDPWS